MKYKVSARVGWDSGHKERFGEPDTIHELTDSEVVESIMRFGRAEITFIKLGLRHLYFQDDYD